jgi:hypothetical protein
MLRHAPSGVVLSTDGPVRFTDRATAERFVRRFLDEPEAWEFVRADAGSRAA